MRLSICLALLMAAGVMLAQSASDPAMQGAAMFRGDAAHTGVYHGSPITTAPRVVWKVSTGGPVFSSAAVWNGVAYVGSNDGNVYALDVKTGTLRWKTATGGEVRSSPAVAGGLVYATSTDGLMYALDAMDGAVRWTFETGGERRFSARHLHGMTPKDSVFVDEWDVYLSSPTPAGGKIYFGSGDGHVYALDAASGREAWRFRTADVVHASPAVVDGRVFIGSWDGGFYALDARTGGLLARFQTGIDTVIANQQGHQGSPAVMDGRVYVGVRDAQLYALDAATLRLEWKRDNRGSWVVLSPTVLDGKVYYGTSDSHRFLALNARDGAELFDADTRFFVFGSAASVGHVLYIPTMAGKLLGLDARTGALLWEWETDAARQDPYDVVATDGTLNQAAFEVPDGLGYFDRIASVGSLMASPVPAEGLILVGSTDGNIYALGTP